MPITSALTPKRTFLGLAGFFTCATPPPWSPDEARHHARAWLISEGRLRVVGTAPGKDATVPRSIVHVHPPGHHYREEQLRSEHIPPRSRLAPLHPQRELHVLRNRPIAPQDRIEVRYVGAYNAIVYAPTVCAIWLGRRLDLSALTGLSSPACSGLPPGSSASGSRCVSPRTSVGCSAPWRCCRSRCSRQHRSKAGSRGVLRSRCRRE